MFVYGYADYAETTLNHSTLNTLLRDVRTCRLCEAKLPLGSNPILRASSTARILIIGQAPGTRVHETGIPWNDPSGDRLRDWMQINREQFYDESLIAIMPMGFCYPGSASSGDRPPRPECAPLWHDPLLAHLPGDRLTIIIGAHAHRRYTSDAGRSLTDAVAAWDELLPDRIVLPHPSPRNRPWLVRHPWFESDTLPALGRRVADALVS